MENFDDGHTYGNFHSYYDFNPVNERMQYLNTFCTALQHSNEQNMIVLCDLGCNEGNLSLELKKTIESGEFSKESTENPKTSNVFDSSSISKLNEIIQVEKRHINYVIKKDGLHTSIRIFIDNIFYGEGFGKSIKVSKARAAQNSMEKINELRCIEPISPPSKSENNFYLALQPLKNQKVYLLGVDLDSMLIEKANDKVKLYQFEDSACFKQVDMMKREDFQTLERYLQQDLPILKKSFDLITCFSMTMWVHLHHGDQGLFTFLKQISEITNHLIIEPQPWKCYRQAIRRLRQRGLKIPPSFETIKYRDNVVQTIETFLIQECEFSYYSLLGRTNWSRRIQLFSKTKLRGISYM